MPHLIPGLVGSATCAQHANAACAGAGPRCGSTPAAAPHVPNCASSSSGTHRRRRATACRGVGDDGGAEEAWETSTAGQGDPKRNITQGAREDLDSLAYPSEPSGDRFDSSFYASEDVSYADGYADDYAAVQSIEGFESLDIGDYPSLDGSDFAGPEISGSIDNLDYDAAAPPMAQPRPLAGSSRLQPFSAGPLSQPSGGDGAPIDSNYAPIDSDYQAANPDETYDDVADVSEGAAPARCLSHCAPCAAAQHALRAFLVSSGRRLTLSACHTPHRACVRTACCRKFAHAAVSACAACRHLVGTSRRAMRRPRCTPCLPRRHHRRRVPRQRHARRRGRRRTPCHRDVRPAAAAARTRGRRVRR